MLETQNAQKCVGVQKMNTLRNQSQEYDGYEPPPEAFDYDSDVTPEAVKYLQDKANAAMKNGKWKVVVGNKFAK